MNTAVLSCRTIGDELLLAESRVKSGYDIFWTAPNLHNYPAKLREEIQRCLDELDGYARVLLAFGFCGNAVADIKTHSFEVILPRVDDCVSLMIGSAAERARLNAGHNSIYLTQGWLQNESNIWSDYRYSADKYGEARAMQIIQMMYAHHDMVSLIDTGAYDLEPAAATAEMICEMFDMRHSVIPGTTSYLEALLTGPYDEDRFICAKPYSILDSSLLTLSER